MKSVNLIDKIVNILGVHFSYNKNLEQDKNVYNHNQSRKHFKIIAHETVIFRR